MKIKIFPVIVLALCFTIPIQAETRKSKYATDIPASITIPNSVETRLGTLRFFDGMPDDKTVQLVYDNLDFQRGVSAFVNAIPIA